MQLLNKDQEDVLKYIIEKSDGNGLVTMHVNDSQLCEEICKKGYLNDFSSTTLIPYFYVSANERGKNYFRDKEAFVRGQN